MGEKKIKGEMEAKVPRGKEKGNFEAQKEKVCAAPAESDLGKESQR